jgi:SAM-dependent methyltransferase
MNEERHWNTIGSKYNEEIFDVFESDRKKRLSVYFRKHANKSHTAIDFGCGTGKSFPHLAPLFGKILAIDISTELLSIAKSSGYSNISFKREDLTNPSLRLPPADFAFCCNVVMLPEPRKNEQMLKNIRKSLKRGGVALFVMPSFESVLLATRRMMDWYRLEGVGPNDVPDDELNYYRGTKRDILQGLIQIDKVVTKHYTEPEIQIMMEHAGFRVNMVEHLEYEWNTEFSDPPKWMKEPYPWDWLVECSIGR